MIYENFFVMADAILAHVARTGDDIVCEDSPRERTLGFRVAQHSFQDVSESDMPMWGSPEYDAFQKQLGEDYRTFCDGPLVWIVRLTSLRYPTTELTQAQYDTWRDYVGTVEGRKQCAEAFSRGVRLWLPPLEPV